MTDRYTGGAYARSHPGWHAEDAPWKAGLVAGVLARQGVAPQRVCDVGCGAGAVLAELRGHLPEATRLEGWDVSPQAIEMARQHPGDRLEFCVGDFLAESGEPADVALALDVVEHVEDYLGFLRRLRERAHFHVFHWPLELNARTALRPSHLLEARRQVGHLHYFCRETALATLRDCGYLVLEERYTPAIFQAPVRGIRSRMGRALRQALWAISPPAMARIYGGAGLLVLTSGEPRP